MNSVAIINYGMCNLDSVARAVEQCGGAPCITSDPVSLCRASHIILPGVGAFKEAMENICKLGFDVAIREQVQEKQTPLLGICLGMQLLATKGYEGGETTGLGLIPGEVGKLIAVDKKERLPHVGWNEVCFNYESKLFHDIPSGKDFYFVHGYHFVCDDKHVLARTQYANGLNSAVALGSAYGVQFHPEKSQRVGIALLENFLNL